VYGIAAELDDLPGHMTAGHGYDLHRQRKLSQGSHQLALVGNTDEGARYRGNDLFPGQGSAPALDQFQMAGGLVGTVNVEVQTRDAVEVIHRNAVLLQALCSGFGAGHGAVEIALVSCQRVDEEIGGGAGTDTDD